MTTLDHRPGCPERRPVGTFVGRAGDALARCPDCGALRVLEHAAPVHATPDPELTPGPEAERVPTSGYVCRDHLDQPVTWRGRGCSHCDRHKHRAHTVTLTEGDITA